jgi:hypothetical protein
MITSILAMIMGTSILAKSESDKLYDNVLELSSISSYYDKNKTKPDYDSNREKLISQIKQNLKDGADVHYHGVGHRGYYDTFQLAYVLDQDEATELMIPYVKNHPPYYNIPCYPFLTHAYAHRGDGYVFRSTGDTNGSFSISSNIYKEYLKIATDAEKRDLEDYKNKKGKYDGDLYFSPSVFFSRYCKQFSGEEKKNCLDHIQYNLNQRKIIPREFEI